MQQETDQEIIKQAVNFDKLKWNEKTLNMMLAPYILMSAGCIYGFFYLLSNNYDIFKMASVIGYLSVVLPMIWFSTRNYLFSLLILEFVALAIPAYNFVVEQNVDVWGFLLSSVIISKWFDFPIRVELYRRRFCISQPHNVKKDIRTGIVLALIFPVLWGISLLWR